jgi:hypothetical protein
LNFKRARQGLHPPTTDCYRAPTKGGLQIRIGGPSLRTEVPGIATPANDWMVWSIWDEID